MSQLLTGDNVDNQRRTLAAAIEVGINWIDTAATYGEGRSEENLGRAWPISAPLDKSTWPPRCGVMPDQLGRITQTVRESVESSLRRLRRPRITLLQVHNSITRVAGAEPTSLTPAHVLSPGGLLEEMQRLRAAGLVEHFGLTALGEPAALREVIDSRDFATIQIPYNLLNASAGREVTADFAETNYGNLIGHAAGLGMGAFAIRVLAGGALAGKPPSPHTLKTPFFPLALYQRDCSRAERLEHLLPPGMQREEAAVRFALSHPGVTSAIVGFATPDEVTAAASFVDEGPLDASLAARLNDAG